MTCSWVSTLEGSVASNISLPNLTYGKTASCSETIYVLPKEMLVLVFLLLYAAVLGSSLIGESIKITEHPRHPHGSVCLTNWEVGVY